MTIETKYNIGDEVWAVMHLKKDSAAVKCRITGIDIKLIDTSVDIRYKLTVIVKCSDPDFYDELVVKDLMPERGLFLTKEELLKSL